MNCLLRSHNSDKPGEVHGARSAGFRVQGVRLKRQCVGLDSLNSRKAGKDPHKSSNTEMDASSNRLED